MDTQSDLRDHADAYLEALAGEHHRYWTGQSAQLRVSDVHTAFPQFHDPEVFDELREAAASPKRSDDERRQLRTWLGLIAAQMEEGLGARASEEIAALEAQQETVLSTERMSFRDALRRLARESSAEPRAKMAAEMGTFLMGHRGPYVRRIEASFELLKRLSQPSFHAVRQLCDIDDGLSAEVCSTFLKTTADAYEDVLGFVLRKLDLSLRPFPRGKAGWQDLLAAGQTPSIVPQLAKDQILPCLTRALVAWGFHPSAEGRIRIEVDPRPGKSRQGHAVPIKVPEEIRLVAHLSGGGTGEAFELLRAYGGALRLAHLPPDASVDVRRLYDPAAQEGWSLFFAQLLTLEPFHRRVLEASKPVAREGARICALFQLAALRRACARRICAFEAEQRGASSGVAEDYADALSNALLVQQPKAVFFREPPSLLRPGDELFAHVLSAQLLGQMHARFEEDFFRNPAASQWLKSVWRSKDRDDGPALLRQLGVERPDLEVASRHLQSVLGA